MSNIPARRLGILWLIIAFVLAVILVMYFTSGENEPNQQTVSTGATPRTPAGTQADITTEDFKNHIADFQFNPYRFIGDRPCIVDFWAPWCTPCLNAAPVIEDVAAEYGYAVYKVNVDHNSTLASSYGVKAIPSLLICKDGKITPYTGNMTHEALAGALTK